MFHELKVRQGMEGSLRGRSAPTIAYEVAGHILLYLLTRWPMVEAAVEHGLNPLQLSFTHAQRELHDLRPALLISTPQQIARDAAAPTAGTHRPTPNLDPTRATPSMHR